VAAAPPHAAVLFTVPYQARDVKILHFAGECLKHFTLFDQDGIFLVAFDVVIELVKLL
jgi:hypothetical protein